MYYVSVKDPDKPERYGLLLGPFDTHEKALARVEDVRRLAETVNDRAVWYAYGTCKSESSAPGLLNDLFPPEVLL